jgi:Family of unknown function (DUF6893)
MVRRVLLTGLVAMVVAVAVRSLPDLNRYRRLRSM